MNARSDPVGFHAFEHVGWEAVPNQYDGSFAHLTAQSVEPLPDATDRRTGSRVLDVATGPGHAGRSRCRSRARALAGRAITPDEWARLIGVDRPHLPRCRR